MIGHRGAIETLQSAVQKGQLPHALLFTGAAGIGKTKLALELARALNCIGDEPPCGQCVHCRQIERGSHPDVTILERIDGKDSVSIAQVRAFRQESALRPYQGRHKVYIIAGAEALTLQAADALLKTLEEPQPYVTIVLTAVDADSLPGTVLSRCRIVPLHPVETRELTEALIERGLEAGAARALARLSRGNVGWALSAVGQPKLAVQRRELLERLTAVPDLDTDARLALAESMVADRKDRSSVRAQLEVLLLLARDLLLVSQGLPAQTVLDEQHAVLRRQAERMTLAGIAAYVQAIRIAMVRIDANVDPRLAVEAALVGGA